MTQVIVCPNCNKEAPGGLYSTETNVQHCGCYYVEGLEKSCEIHFTNDIAIDLKRQKKILVIECHCSLIQRVNGHPKKFEIYSRTPLGASIHNYIQTLMVDNGDKIDFHHPSRINIINIKDYPLHPTQILIEIKSPYLETTLYQLVDIGLGFMMW